jgi:hypothetical protein
MAADNVALRVDQLPLVEFGAGVISHLLHHTGELVPHYNGWLDPSGSPFIPIRDMDVGAAKAGVFHSYEYVRGPAFRFGDVGYYEARFGGKLADRLHWIPLARRCVVPSCSG